jgi:hypothetical protein
MKDSHKIAVIIIEDDKMAFKAIKSIISDEYPNEKQKYNKDDTFENFRKNLQDALSEDHTDPNEPEKSRKVLFEKLKSYCGRNEEPIYLIDFLLKGEKYDSSINGIHFHKLIHRELYKEKMIPSFFITAAEGTNLSMVQDYCEKDINDKQICHFRPKPDEWNDVNFKRSVIEFIREALTKPQNEKDDESKNTEDYYKP